MGHGLKTLLSLGACTLLVSAAATASQVTNGSFETGNLSGWAGCDSGRVGVVSGLTSASPTHGQSMGMVSPDSYNFDFTPFEEFPPGTVKDGCTDTSTIPAGERLLGFNGIDYNGGYALFWQSFTITDPRYLSFDWNFLTNDYGQYDSAIFGVFPTLNAWPTCELGTAFDDLDCPVLGVLAYSADATIGQNPPDQPGAGEYYKQTGWSAGSSALLGAGTYTVLFGVAQGLDPKGGSALLIDRVMLKPVPEPGTLALLSLGLLGLGFTARRRLH